MYFIFPVFSNEFKIGEHSINNIEEGFHACLFLFTFFVKIGFSCKNSVLIKEQFIMPPKKDAKGGAKDKGGGSEDKGKIH